MVLLKRNSRHSKDFLDRKRFIKQNKLTVTSPNSELVPPWKISGMLIFLAVVIFLLITHEADEQLESNGNSREIPNPEKPLPPSSSKLFKFKHAAISTDSQACSDIARKLMEKQPNGFDLALSALICNSLTNIQSMGLFGGFLLTAHIASEQKSIVIDAQMTAPENFQSPNDGSYAEIEHGPMSIATSGFLKAVWEIHRNYSSLSWNEIVDPIIEFCREGIHLTKHLRDSIEMNSHILNDTYFRSVFIESNTGRIKRVGSRIVLAKQCDFLEVLKRQNSSMKDIFSGEIGDILASDLRSANSRIKLSDLVDYNVKVYEAKKVTLTDDKILLVPKTCAILIPSILNVLMQYNFNSTWFDTQHNINMSILMHHRIIESFKYVFAMRSHLGDSDFLPATENVVNYLLSSEFAQHIRQSINDSATSANYNDYNLSTIVAQNHGTSHVSIVAENGDAISVTSSINYYFGSGIVGDKSGLIFNNGMNDFSYENRSINYFGLKETPNNYPQPKKRALSSMSPLIIIDSKSQRQPNLVIGAAGGSKIISALSIAILRFLCDSDDLKEIVDASRIHHQLIPDVVEYEYGIISNIIDGLERCGHKTSRYRYRGTIINALKIDQRKIHAISDYRKDASGVAGF